MMALILILSLLRSDPFLVDAEWRSVIRLDEKHAHLRSLLGSTEFLSRVMPGVTEIRQVGPENFIYRTERAMPFAGVVRTEFRIRREKWSEAKVLFRTPREEDPNYMVLEFTSEEEPGGGFTLHARIRVRLTREDASDVHPFAPLLGAEFIGERMERDLEQTLATLAERLEDPAFDPPIGRKE